MVNSTDKLKRLKSQMKINPEKLSVYLENFIIEHTKNLKKEGVIMGLSGGIDSAVVASLCKKALGSDNILALLMPDSDSEKKHLTDALNFAEELNIKTKVIDITPYIKKVGAYNLMELNKFPLPRSLKSKMTKKVYDFYMKKTGKTVFSESTLGFNNSNKVGQYLNKSIAYIRIKHRLRMILLYLNGEIENKLVVGAANKTESNIGFFVKHGCDHAADIMPIINLYKTQVIELAKYLDIPPNIIKKEPSPDVFPGLTDEMMMGITYEKLDLILLAIKKGWKKSDIAVSLNLKEKEIEYVFNLIRESEHMRKIFTPTNIL